MVRIHSGVPRLPWAVGRTAGFGRLRYRFPKGVAHGHIFESGEMMSVRAKVRCDGIEGNAVRFSTVYEPDASKDTENARFTKATPWGQIQLGIDNPDAIQQFKAGESYYVDFTPAP